MDDRIAVTFAKPYSQSNFFVKIIIIIIFSYTFPVEDIRITSNDSSIRWDAIDLIKEIVAQRREMVA